MKTIGILGGLGPESTIAYYAHITRRYYELRSDYSYPEILIHSFNFKEFIEAAYELPDRVRTAQAGPPAENARPACSLTVAGAAQTGEQAGPSCPTRTGLLKETQANLEG